MTLVFVKICVTIQPGKSICANCTSELAHRGQFVHILLPG